MLVDIAGSERLNSTGVATTCGAGAPWAPACVALALRPGPEELALGLAARGSGAGVSAGVPAKKGVPPGVRPRPAAFSKACSAMECI